MKNHDLRRVDTVVRASVFATKWKLDHPPYGAVVKRLHAAAVRLPALEIEQRDAHSSWQGHSTVLDDLRDQLRESHMIKLSRVGRKILKHKPGVRAALKVPGKRASSKALVAAATTMAKFMQEDAQVFLDEDQPRNAFAKLRAATRKFASCQRTIDEQIERQKKATAALAKEVPPAREDVDILDGLLAERKKGTDGLASDWAQAKRVGKRKGAPRDGKWNWPTKKHRPK